MLEVKTMTPDAQSLLNRLNKSYRKAAFWSTNYQWYVDKNIIPKAGIVRNDLYLPADGWNAGHNYRIYIPKNTGIILILPKDTYKLGIGGTDTDQLIGLWLAKFQYGYGEEKNFEAVGGFITA